MDGCDGGAAGLGKGSVSNDQQSHYGDDDSAANTTLAERFGKPIRPCAASGHFGICRQALVNKRDVPDKAMRKHSHGRAVSAGCNPEGSRTCPRSTSRSIPITAMMR
jgi:hypothetical protein